MNPSSSLAWLICSLLVLTSFEVSSMTEESSVRNSLIKKHTTRQSFAAMSLEQRGLVGMKILMRHLQRSTASMTAMNLSASDAALLASLVSTESAFQQSMQEESARAMQTICSWGTTADAGVLGAAVTAVDEAEDSKRAARYGAFLRSLSDDGLAKIKAVLLEKTSSGSSSRINLASLASERPDIVKQGVLRRCVAGSTAQAPGVISTDTRIVVPQGEGK